ncbi:MAG: sulfurtransferase TusA family protein [Candidatus Symbiothrix sp.]|jgi:TusA-related sulfurtransferase|nr:sulfurtransferase TusA family protein [Candidatus Symbiothrix sp.]
MANIDNTYSAKSPSGDLGVSGVYYLDVTKEHCPMTFVKTKIELNKLQKGDILHVKVTEGEPLENIPKSAEEQGFNVLSVKETETQGIYNIEIKK